MAIYAKVVSCLVLSVQGHVTGQVTAKDQDGKEIACVKLDVEL